MTQPPTSRTGIALRWNARTGRNGAAEGEGNATVAQGPDGTIAVRTYNKTGNAADLGFHTIVSCPIF